VPLISQAILAEAEFQGFDRFFSCLLKIKEKDGGWIGLLNIVDQMKDVLKRILTCFVGNLEGRTAVALILG
jgi:hypothetical protein